MASVLMSVIEMSRMKIFSTIPPRPRVDLKRRPTSVPRNWQFSTRMFLTPPLISEPTTKPPCPAKTVQPSTTTFSQGRPRRRPSLSLPLLMQMPSSPASNFELTMRAFLHDSKSRASPFWAKAGLRARTLSMMTFSHISGWIFQAGEFWKMTPWRSTFLQLTSEIITGRRKRL